jgi:hypothetical protein
MNVRGFISLILAAALMPASGAAPAIPAAGMFDLYRQNRMLGIPNQITEDFLLMSYSMISEQAVADIETGKDLPGLTALVDRLRASAAKAGDGEAAKADRQFLEVVRDLLSENPAEPSGTVVADPVVAKELELIRGAAGPARSELLKQTIDYSQMKPRGHYTKTPELSRYFQAVRYSGEALFYVKDSQATGIDAATADRLTQQAVLLSGWIRDDAKSGKWFGEFQARRNWMFGPPEDLRAEDVNKLADTMPTASPADIRAALLRYAKKNGRQPAILSGSVDSSKLEKGVTTKDALTGWRLLPGSFTPGAAAAQLLVYPSVGKYLGKGTPASVTTVDGMKVKGFPLAAEMMSMLGSKEAAKLATDTDETNYEGYSKARLKASRQLIVKSGLSSEQLGLLRDWFSQTDKSDDRLATARGFWTWTLHGSVLYAKQSSTGVGKGLSPRDDRATAWLEPSVSLYTGLLKISKEWEQRTENPAFAEYSKVLTRCIEIAGKEKAGTALAPEDVEYLNGLDKNLLTLTGTEDHPIATDFHTDLNSGQVLTEALGYPRAVMHADARGARFAPEEFKQKISERLTDEAWQEMLKQREEKK